MTLAYDPPPDPTLPYLHQGASSGERLTIQIIRGGSGRAETLVSEGDTCLFKEDLDEMRARAEKLGLEPI